MIYQSPGFPSRRSAAIFVFAFLVAGATIPAFAETSKLHLGSDVWPPFTAESGGTRLAIDLVHTALDRAEIEPTTRVIESADLIARIRNAEFDGSAALWRSRERERFLLYSEAYLENRLVLVGRKGSDVSAARLSDLEGDRVALVDAFAYGEAVEDAKGPLFIRGRDHQSNLQRLLEGQVDYMLVDELLIHYVLQNQAQEAAEFLEIGSNPLARRTLHLAIRKTTPDAKSIIGRFNEEIRQMLLDGTYNEILRLRFIRVDVDGDGLLETVTKADLLGSIAPVTSYDIVTPELKKRQDGIPLTDRFYIDGEVYEGWENIPNRYKIPSGTHDLGPPSPALVFRFRF